MFYLPLALTITSNVLYHLFLKMTPSTISPLFSLAISYAVAMATTIVIYPLFPNGLSFLENAKTLHWTSVALGLSIVGLEVGFLLAYRLGWQISLACMISNVAVALLLIPIGVKLFHETLSFTNIAGVLLCLAGLALINQRP